MNNLKRYLILITGLIVFSITGCKNNPSSYNPVADQNNIPWSRITSGKIVYSEQVITDQTINFLFELDAGTKQLKVLNRNTLYQFAYLTWSTDASKITFVDYDDSGTYLQLFNIDSNGTNITNIYPDTASHSYPAWSRDGRLAYWSNSFNFPAGIAIDGTAFFNNKVCNLSRPAWSPDGKYLVVSLGDSTTQGALYKINLSDKTYTLLLEGTGIDSVNGSLVIYDQPQFSPDGSQIVFAKWGYSLGSQSEIWVIDADGTNLRRITTGYYDFNPVWSPDGTEILFERSGYPDNLYIVNADGSNLAQVTQNGGSYPSWTK